MKTYTENTTRSIEAILHKCYFLYTKKEITIELARELHKVAEEIVDKVRQDCLKEKYKYPCFHCGGDMEVKECMHSR